MPKRKAATKMTPNARPDKEDVVHHAVPGAGATGEVVTKRSVEEPLVANKMFEELTDLDVE